MHKDIAEEGKDHSNITSLLRLGKTLKIGDDYFEDIDEVCILFFWSGRLLNFLPYIVCVATIVCLLCQFYISISPHSSYM